MFLLSTQVSFKQKLICRSTQPASQQFNVTRRVYQQDALNNIADYRTPQKPWRKRFRKLLRICGCNDYLDCVPLMKWLPKYSVQEHLMGDLVAGATTAVIHIPQGMAYALLAEVPPIVGLYMAFFPVLIYVIFGTSHHVSMGTFAVACIMAGKVVTKHAALPDPYSTENTTITEIAADGVQYTPIEVVCILSLTVGLLQTFMWMLRLGAVSTLLSEPVVSGFTTAASFHVLASQLKDLFGVKIEKILGRYKVVLTVIQVANNLPNAQVTACIISLSTCFILCLNNELLKPRLSKVSRVPIPIELLVIVIGTTVCRTGGLQKKFGIDLVGTIPTGLPAPVLPPVELLPDLALDAFIITMVTYSISMSMALIFAAKAKYEIDANQELLALGAGNMVGAFFGCAPFCASLSRSYLQFQAGGKTAVSSIVSATIILFVLLWIGPFFEELPRCVLASIIVVSLKGMFLQVKELVKFWKLSKLDAVVWLVTFLPTLFINIDIGLGIGLLASVGALFCRSQKPYTCLLGRVQETDLYLDIKRYRGAQELPGIKIFHYCGGLNFASKNLFRSTLFHKVGYFKTLMQAEETDTFERDPNISRQVKCVIIDATALSYVDVPGIKTLVAVEQELMANHITVLLAGANGPVLEMIEDYNALEADPLLLPVFPTVHDAVIYFYVQESKMQSALSAPETNEIPS